MSNNIILKNNKVSIDLINSLLYKNSNKISTTMYKPYNFLYLGLFNQIKQFTNIYFIIIAILSVIKEVSTIDPVSAFLPVLFVIFFSLIFDWGVDIKRYLSDKKINKKEVNIIRNGKKMKIKSQDVKIGDYMILAENEVAMADIVLLSYKNTKNYSFIDTSSLDGEKTLKPKMSVFDKNLNLDFFAHDPLFPDINITYKHNIASLSYFEGEISYSQKFKEGNNVILKKKKLSLDINFFIPRTARIRNTWDMIGLVVYVGKSTKVMKNTQKRIFKQTNVEKKMNEYIKIVVILLILLLILLAAVSTFDKMDFYYEKTILFSDRKLELFFIYSILGYLLLNNTILPISLIITLQIVKLVMNYLFDLNNEYKDKETGKKTILKTVNLHEELGQIEYILSDKTGTLTENIMVAQYYQILDKRMKLEEFKKKDLNETNLDLKEKETFNFKKIVLNSNDETETMTFNNQEEIDELYLMLINVCHDCFSKDKENEKVNNHEVDMSLNSLNNFDNLKNHTDYEGSSPDEIALLKGSRDFCNLMMKGTNKNLTILYNSKNENIEIEKMFVNKFNSDRKMMSVVIRFRGKIILLAKGADNVIYKKCNNEMSDHFKDDVNYYLEKGLRILFMAVRLISEEEFTTFKENLDKAKFSEKSKEEIDKVKGELERNLYLIGASAIEDKLQKEVPETVQILKEADIKIWMITGDKSETAVNIAYLSTLFDKSHPPEIFDEDIFQNEILKQISIKKKKNWIWRWKKKKRRKKEKKSTKKRIPSELVPHDGEFLAKKKSIKPTKNLLVTGDVLVKGLQQKHRKRFTRYIMKFDCVVFARTSPNQKVKIARLLKKRKKVVLAVGDGANDVNMIQEANVGVGIIGEEGKQAVNASDFGIPSFRFLKPLILNHGRNSYYRISMMILLFFFKNFLFTFPQIFYAFFCDFSILNIYNDWYMNFYNLFFTGFNVSAKGISEINFNEKLSKRKNYLPQVYLYFLGQKNKIFNFKKFFFWLFTGLLESFIIFMIARMLLDNNTIYFENHEVNYQVFSVLIFSSIIFHLNNKLFYYTNTFDVFIIFGFLFLPFSFFIYVFATDNNKRLGYYKAVSICWEVPHFYVYFIFIVIVLWFFTQTFHIIGTYFFPGICEKLVSFNHKLNDENQRLQLQKMKEEDLKNNFINYIFR